MKSVSVRVLSMSLAFGLFASAAAAEPPSVQTPSPVIYLADNLDEKDGLGFCIDTIGRGLGDRLHTHSCKPGGGDVQYSFDTETGHIRSAAFDNKCAAVMSAPVGAVVVALLACENTSEQTFSYAPESLEIRVAGNADLCLIAGSVSHRAGRFMKRDLLIGACADADAALKQWVVRP